MIRKIACVKSRFGIHARPSAKIATMASESFPRTEITLIDKTSQKCDAKSILGLLMLAVPCGASVTICASGVDEENAANAIANIIETYEV